MYIPVATHRDRAKLKEDSVLLMGMTFKAVRAWFGQALEHTIGNPSSDKHLPPPIGPQPYTHKPEKFHY